ncbi:MAG: transposase [Bacteroidota bacterium]
MEFPEYWPTFLTATNLNWLPLMQADSHKKIIIDSLAFLVKNKRVKVYAFVIMNNHLHLIWQVLPGHTPDAVQRDFLKYTGQQMKFNLKENDTTFLEQFKVGAKDREYQFWERNSLSIELRTRSVFEQKFLYIHYNPVKAGLCALPEEYYYSSAKFYETGVDNFGFLTRWGG